MYEQRLTRLRHGWIKDYLSDNNVLCAFCQGHNFQFYLNIITI